jgi:hypothetical protein
MNTDKYPQVYRDFFLRSNPDNSAIFRHGIRWSEPLIFGVKVWISTPLIGNYFWTVIFRESVVLPATSLHT